MDKCKDCISFKEDTSFQLGGICELSRSGESKLMIARDDISENYPFMEVSPKFGCVEHKSKI